MVPLPFLSRYTPSDQLSLSDFREQPRLRETQSKRGHRAGKEEGARSGELHHQAEGGESLRGSHRGAWHS